MDSEQQERLQLLTYFYRLAVNGIALIETMQDGLFNSQTVAAGIASQGQQMFSVSVAAKDPIDLRIADIS